jgi:23S rRNA pseudouridine1911/1915/1917 synthase
MRVVVSPSDAGQRLDRFLAALSLLGTRSHIKVLLEAGRVTVNGQKRKAGYLLRAQEVIEVLPLAEPPAIPLPQEIPLEVLYEDVSLAVINKPAGMVVHPAPGWWEGTVVNALLSRWQGHKMGGEPLRPGIVHRLDKETSGVLVVAKDLRTLEALAQQFQERKVSKTYLAVVVGRFGQKEGRIVLPVGRHPLNGKKMSVHSRRGREAMSRYRVIEECSGVTVVRLFPETGRTHQLRVHLAAVGHPVVGDKLYGSAKALRTIADTRLRAVVQAFPRQALHAELIRFVHPLSNAEVEVRAPLPADLVCLLSALQEEPRAAA